jgi:CDP-diacylglycerol--glycerol-3-phosphate 3-phosphatidyltransferase
MTTANKLTLIRVAIIPLFVIAILLNMPWSRPAALVLFILASLTDFIDGYVARKYNQVTNFGKFMDPVADKLLITAAILVFVEGGQCPSWVALIIIAREFAVTALRLIAANGGLVIAAAMSGKVKTASSIVCICIMLTSLHKIVLFGGITLNTVCLAVMLVTTVISGAEYFIKNHGLLNAGGK